MAKEGYVWMCFTNPAVSGDNSTEIADGFHMLKVYTQTAAQITDNILSVSRMVKLLGFELKFRPTGWEGFKRKDPNTGRIVKIPVFYDDADMLSVHLREHRRGKCCFFFTKRSSSSYPT